DLVVDAKTQIKTISLGISGGKAGDTAVNGVVNFVGIDDTTLAQIGQAAIVSAAGKVDVTANDDPLVVNIAGGVSIGTSVGFGLTVGTNVITRDTKAIIGNADVTLGNGAFAPDTGVNASANTIDLGYVHGYATGDQVVYSNGGDDSIGGLAEGSSYYVRRVNATTIGLARSLAEANNTAPRLSSASVVSDVIDLGYAHGFQTG